MADSANKIKKMSLCQEQLLLLLKYVDEVCIKYGINYSVSSGTMIGAAREHGFIAWDDDADVIFLRSEFVKFLDAIKKERRDDIGIYDPKEKEYFLDFNLRLFKKDYIIRDDDSNLNMYDGIFSHPTLDIYVLDEIPTNKLFNRLFVLRQQFVFGLAIGHRQVINYKKYSFVEKLVISVLSKFGKLFSVKKLCEMHDKVSMGYYGKNTCKYYGTSWAPTYPKYQYDKKDIDQYIKITFEDTNLMIFKNYDKILRYDYGDDYMKPLKTHTHDDTFVKNI